MMTRDHAIVAAIVGLACHVVGCTPQPTKTGELPPPPKLHRCQYVAEPIVIDGRLDDQGWADAAWTDLFMDIEGEHMPSPRYQTRAKMAWDDEYFYVCAWMDEPHVWGTLTEFDSIIYHDNDFEVFIDPDGDWLNYYEVEVNTLNTVFDLLLVKAYRAGGPNLNGWNLEGLRTAVHVDGTINDPSDEDRGWSVEIAMPWSSLAEHSRQPTPPNSGDVWRVNFSRVQWRHSVVDGEYVKWPRHVSPEDNWVWSPQGAVDMHMPERWGFVVFERASP